MGCASIRMAVQAACRTHLIAAAESDAILNRDADRRTGVHIAGGIMAERTAALMLYQYVSPGIQVIAIICLVA
jgi:hypothetical protein